MSAIKEGLSLFLSMVLVIIMMLIGAVLFAASLKVGYTCVPLLKAFEDHKPMAKDVKSTNAGTSAYGINGSSATSAEIIRGGEKQEKKETQKWEEEQISSNVGMMISSGSLNCSPIGPIFMAALSLSIIAFGSDHLV